MLLLLCSRLQFGLLPPKIPPEFQTNEDFSQLQAARIPAFPWIASHKLTSGTWGGGGDEFAFPRKRENFVWEIPFQIPSRPQENRLASAGKSQECHWKPRKIRSIPSPKSRKIPWIPFPSQENSLNSVPKSMKIPWIPLPTQENPTNSIPKP